MVPLHSVEPMRPRTWPAVARSTSGPPQRPSSWPPRSTRSSPVWRPAGSSAPASWVPCSCSALVAAVVPSPARTRSTPRSVCASAPTSTARDGSTRPFVTWPAPAPTPVSCCRRSTQRWSTTRSSSCCWLPPGPMLPTRGRSLTKAVAGCSSARSRRGPRQPAPRHTRPWSVWVATNRDVTSWLTSKHPAGRSRSPATPSWPPGRGRPGDPAGHPAVVGHRSGQRTRPPCGGHRLGRCPDRRDLRPWTRGRQT